MQASYLFYDIETTGINPCFDQIIQFAAIRTDLALNEIERVEFRASISEDVIPHPAAMLVCNILPSEQQGNASEYELVRQIHDLVNQPNMTSLGYNTLGFDDEFLRFAFYRHLLDPYTHQYNNGCGRMDIFPMAVMYYLFKPDVVQWPTVDGKRSLKLELLNNDNK